MEYHNTHHRGRANRRHFREVAIGHAFRVMFWSQNDRNDWARKNHMGYTTAIGVNKWLYQDICKYEVLLWAKQRADNMRLCSCFLCSGYKKYAQSRSQLREQARTIDDLLEVYD